MFDCLLQFTVIVTGALSTRLRQMRAGSAIDPGASRSGGTS
jgi:hypothetical protein